MLQSYLLTSAQQNTPRQQKRFILHGLGGSGKSQVSVKFAQDNRNRYSTIIQSVLYSVNTNVSRFWGVFWVDATRPETAERSFGEIARLGWSKTELRGWKTLVV